MPGYRPIADDLTGSAQVDARTAEDLVRAGNVTEAALVLETTVTVSLQSNGAIPPWLCGRLACVYRTLERYDDEVALITRYRESQVSEDMRTRYDARLSKAQALAEKYRKRDSGALASIRLIKKSRRSAASSRDVRE